MSQERVVQAILEDNGRMSDSDMYLVLVGFLNSEWFSRKHTGLRFADNTKLSPSETKREVLRFIESLKRDE